MSVRASDETAHQQSHGDYMFCPLEFPIHIRWNGPQRNAFPVIIGSGRCRNATHLQEGKGSMIIQKPEGALSWLLAGKPYYVFTTAFLCIRKYLRERSAKCESETPSRVGSPPQPEVDINSFFRVGDSSFGASWKVWYEKNWNWGLWTANSCYRMGIRAIYCISEPINNTCWTLPMTLFRQS